MLFKRFFDPLSITSQSFLHSALILVGSALANSSPKSLRIFALSFTKLKYLVGSCSWSHFGYIHAPSAEHSWQHAASSARKQRVFWPLKAMTMSQGLGVGEGHYEEVWTVQNPLLFWVSRACNVIYMTSPSSVYDVTLDAAISR